MTGRIPRTFIDELLSRIDIVELIDARVPLRKMGSNYSACCPFHQEKTPSFTVSQTKQFYYCFGCGASGNAISFLIEYDHMEFTEAVESLAHHLGLEIPVETNKAQLQRTSPDLYKLMAQVTKFYQQQLRHSQPAITYLKQRGLTGQIAKEFSLGYAPAGWDPLIKHFGNHSDTLQQLNTAGMLIKKNEGGYYDRFRERIMFPIRDRRGRVIGFGGRTLGDDTPKYLNSPETTLFHKGQALYGLYEAQKSCRQLSRLLIVEGYMDLVALAQHGIRYVVATLGTATTAEHISLLCRHTKEIIFSFDGDRAGKTAAWRALETALPLLEDGIQIRFIFLPDNEDPDSLIRKEGTEGFIERIQNAIPLSDFFFTHLSMHLNIASIDGKASLAKPAGELLAKMPNGVFRLGMFERLAQIVRVDSQQLQHLAGIKPTAPLFKSILHAKKTPRKRASPVRIAIALLLQHPQLAQTLEDIEFIKELDLPGIPILIQLINILKLSPQLTTGTLLEHWRDQPEHAQLLKLATWEHFLPEEGITKEFQDTLQRLYQLARTQKIEGLLAKANQQGLSNQEKQLLQALIVAEKST